MASNPSTVDSVGRQPFSAKMRDVPHTEKNSVKASHAPIPSAVRMPDARLHVCVIGGDGPLGLRLVWGLSNPNYAAAFHVFVLESAAMAAVTEDNARTLLAPRLAGMHTVIMADYRPVHDVTAAVVDEREAAVLAACKEAKVQRFLPCPFGFEVKGASRAAKALDSVQRAVKRQAALSTSGLAYTVISCGVLTEHLFSPIAGVDMQRGIVQAPGREDAAVTTTTLDDLARLLPEVLLSPSAKNQHVDLASATVTYSEIADILRQVSGRPVTTSVVSASDIQQRAQSSHADPAAVLSFLIQSGAGLLWSKADSWNAKHVPHIHTTPVRVWAQQHLAPADSPQRLPVSSAWEPNLHPAARSAPEHAAVTHPDKLGSTFTGEQAEILHVAPASLPASSPNIVYLPSAAPVR